MWYTVFSISVSSFFACFYNLWKGVYLMVSLLFLFIKQLFSFIDRMVVFVIKYLYQLIVAIADTNVFGNLIYDYLGRIYMFLSVFMVFKLSISIINYVINPDSLSDKRVWIYNIIYDWYR